MVACGVADSECAPRLHYLHVKSYGQRFVSKPRCSGVLEAPSRHSKKFTFKFRFAVELSPSSLHYSISCRPVYRSCYIVSFATSTQHPFTFSLLLSSSLNLSPRPVLDYQTCLQPDACLAKTTFLTECLRSRTPPSKVRTAPTYLEFDKQLTSPRRWMVP